MKTKLLISTIAFALTVAHMQTIAQVISGGGGHSLFLCNDSTIRSVGWNNNGQLGNGNYSNQTNPVQATGLTGIIAVSAGCQHSLALKKDSTVYSCGYNFYGQLGDGTTNNRNTFQQINGLDSIIAIASGCMHSLALKSDGTVWTWGYNFFGQLGDSTTTNRTTPVKVKNLIGVIAIAGGQNHSLALKNDGTVWAWGYNNYGQLGCSGCPNPSKVPVQVSGLTGITAIATGDGDHSYALKNNGTEWSWGRNLYGELGDGTTTNQYAPVQVAGLSNVIAIGAGEYHAIALKSGGTVWTWGWNYYGQMGNGTTSGLNPNPNPIQITSLTTVTAIAGGGEHSLALKSNGTVKSFGSNNSGQLGDGTMVDKSSPVSVTNLCTVVVVTNVPIDYSEKEFIIFPNPFSSQTVLQTDNPLYNATLTVDNCFGQTVKEIKNISGQTVTLARDNLPSGLYFVRLTQDNQVIATKKLLITD